MDIEEITTEIRRQVGSVEALGLIPTKVKMDTILGCSLAERMISRWKELDILRMVYTVGDYDLEIVMVPGHEGITVE